MPDEHIIMACTGYLHDDFGGVTLEYRRDRNEQEQEDLIMLLPQDTQVLDEDSSMQKHLGYIKTREGTFYAWPNSCQHRVMKFENKTKRVLKRSFIAFFLVDPDIPIVSTDDIAPQYTDISKSESKKIMEDMVKQRSGLKIKMNEGLSEEISFCEH